MAAALDTTSWMFAVEGTVMNGYLLYHAQRFGQDQSNGNARGVFKASLWHLPVVLALFVFHSKQWIRDDDVQQSSAISTFIQQMRERLKESCIHEIVQSKDSASLCPAVVAGEAGERAKLSVASTQESRTSNT